MSLKFTAGLLIGAAVGAAVVYFLNTEEGKAFSAKLKEDAREVENDFANLAEDLIQKGKSFMEDMEEEVDKATS